MIQNIFCVFFFLFFRQWPTVPQVYIKGEFIGGCDIVLNMHHNGELEDLLLKEGLVDSKNELEQEEK